MDYSVVTTLSCLWTWSCSNPCYLRLGHRFIWSEARWLLQVKLSGCITAKLHPQGKTDLSEPKSPAIFAGEQGKSQCCNSDSIRVRFRGTSNIWVCPRAEYAPSENDEHQLLGNSPLGTLFLDKAIWLFLRVYDIPSLCDPIQNAHQLGTLGFILPFWRILSAAKSTFWTPS